MKIDTLSSKLADEGIRKGELAYATRKGREEGREEGVVLEKIEIVKAMLAKGFDWNVISDILQMDEASYRVLSEKYASESISH